MKHGPAGFSRRPILFSRLLQAAGGIVRPEVPQIRDSVAVQIAPVKRVGREAAGSDLEVRFLGRLTGAGARPRIRIDRLYTETPDEPSGSARSIQRESSASSSSSES